MHSCICAWKIISGVLTGQPCDRPLPLPYSSMHVENGTALASVPPPAKADGGRLRRSSVSFGSGGSDGAPHSSVSSRAALFRIGHALGYFLDRIVDIPAYCPAKRFVRRREIFVETRRVEKGSVSWACAFARPIHNSLPDFGSGDSNAKRNGCHGDGEHDPCDQSKAAVPAQHEADRHRKNP
jgi:hypothetical protein